MSKAYVLLSGGVDSSTCLALALKEFGSVTGIGVVYGQRHEKELERAQQVAVKLGADFLRWDIQGTIPKGGITDEALEIPSVSYSELPQGVSPTFVPFRNGILLSVATALASIDGQAEAIYFGAHAEDAENWAYPDCTPEFVGAMAAAIYIGTYHRIRLHTPLIHISKAEVIRMGDSLNVPWELTWSCYEGKHYHCGVCPTCRARSEAFQLAGVEDPTNYLAAMALITETIS